MYTKTQQSQLYFFIKTCLISLCVCLILTMSHQGEKGIQPTTSEAGRKTHLRVTSSSKIASGKNRHFDRVQPHAGQALNLYKQLGVTQSYSKSRDLSKRSILLFSSKLTEPIFFCFCKVKYLKNHELGSGGSKLVSQLGKNNFQNKYVSLFDFTTQRFKIIFVSLWKEIMKSYITSKNEEKFRKFYVFEYFMWAFFVIHEGQVCLF